MSLWDREVDAIVSLMRAVQVWQEDGDEDREYLVAHVELRNPLDGSVRAVFTLEDDFYRLNYVEGVVG